MTLIDFLLARIAEDEHSAECVREDEPPAERDASGVIYGDRATYAVAGMSSGRWRAECEAKRRTLEVARLFGCEKAVARYLALPYADHPDYREEWKP